MAVAGLLAVSLGFAVLALALRLRNDRSEREERRLRALWEPRILEILAGGEPEQVLLGLVARRDRRVFLAFLLDYARRLHGDERATVTRLARPHLAEVAVGARRGSAESRARSVQLLAELGLPRYAGEVAAALEDRSSIVAMIAARGLLQPGYEAYFVTVLGHLPRFTLWTRSFLSSLLARAGPGAGPHLRRMLGNPSHAPLTRAVAADALRLQNDLEAVPLAAELVQRPAPDERELTVSSIRILRSLGHAKHAPLLLPLAKSGDDVIRAAAVGALGALGGTEAAPVLEEAIEDTSYWVSLEAARGLVALGAGDVLERLAVSEEPAALLARQVLRA